MQKAKSGYGVKSFTPPTDPVSLNAPGTGNLRRPRLANNSGLVPKVKKPKLFKGFKDVQKSMSKRLRTI